IDQRVDSIVRRDPTVMDIYSEALLKDYIYKDALRRQVIQREVNSRVRVDDEEIKRACRQEIRDNREVDVGHILIRGHEPAALEKIGGIRRQLMEGADFELTASTYSEDPSAAANHGRLGFVSRGQFVKEFDDVAFSLAPGQVSEPVQTQFGYHLIKVFGERKKAGIDCERLDDANRLRIYNRLFSAASEEQMKEFMARLRKRADIQVNIQ
ncbi:MAG: peptidylprolyl isomerase, partial [SAR324 cluster bacterium]